MLKRGTILDITDHTVEILETPEDTGDRYRVRVIAEPGAPGVDGNFPHRHPTLIETFRCLSGEMTVRVGNALSVLPPGETAEVGPGQVHGFVNTGESPLVVDSDVIFPNGYRRTDDLLGFAAIYDRLKREGPVNPRTGEPPTLHMAVLTHAYRRALTMPGVAGALMPPMALLGRLLGYGSELEGSG